MKDIERYYQKKQIGRCHLCTNKAIDGQVYCEQHRQERLLAERIRRAAKVRTCPACKVRPLAYRRRLCDACGSTTGKRFRTYQKQWRDSQKLATFAAYGGAHCSCCGEKELLFLTLDHINNDGSAHRKELKRYGGWKFCIWLKQRHYPAGYQVLCCNCNRGRWMNGGICPHKEKS